MASAGRILIMPKGEWNAETEYKMLDLVYHNGTSWLGKEASTNIEPSIANAHYWFKMCDSVDLSGILERITTLENQMVAPTGIDYDDVLSADMLGNAALSSDLFAKYDKPTFVQWNSATLNTPNKSGLTGCVEGFAIVHGDYSAYHTVVAWTKGGGTINLFIHQVNQGTVIGWETFLKSSGGTLTGDLNIDKSLPRLHLTNKETSRKARFEASNDGSVKIGNYKSDKDHISFQVRDSSVGLDNILRVVVDGDKIYRAFGEHNIDLVKNLLGGLKIATGSYIGKGTFGENDKNSITFDFEPKLVILPSGTVYSGGVIWYSGIEMTAVSLLGSSAGMQIQFEQDGKTLRWYQLNSAAYQLNTLNTVYHWIAIG